MSFMSVKSGLMNVSPIHLYLVVIGSKIQLGEYYCTSQLINCWNGETVLNGDRIQRTVVNTKPPRAIFLLH